MDAFLAEINLAQHATILDKLGYDDPNDFAEFEASDLKKLETRCADEGMPPAHVDKIVRAVKKRSAMAAAAATASVTPAPAPALTSSPLTLPHAAPMAGLATPSPMAVVQQAALDVGQAARSLGETAHAEKVRGYIQDARRLNPDAPRLLYGVGNSQPLRMPYYTSMNAAALPLLEHDPTLIHWDGSKARTAVLIAAAKVAANAVHDFAKPKGSRAGGVAGDAGHRAAPSSGALSVGGSSKLSLTSKATSSSSSGNLSRLTKALRTSELELLPGQILALSGKIKAAHDLAAELAKRGTIEDLREVVATREKTDKLQHEVRPSRRLSCPCMPAHAPDCPFICMH